MKSISIWAKSHRFQAILYLLLLQVLILSAYFIGGVFLFAFDIVFPQEITFIGSGLFIIACLVYPYKDVAKGWFKHSYKKAKSVQAMVLLSAIILVCNAGNQLARSSMITSTDASFEIKPVVLDYKVNQKKQIKKTRKQRRLERKALKKKWRAYVKNTREKVNLTTGDILLMILLGILFTIVAGYIVLGLYCNLACSGQASAALIVLISGTFLWILGLIGIVSLIRKRRWKKQKQQQVDGAPD